MRNYKRSLVGVDIGGTKIEAILWQGGKIRAVKIIPTPKKPEAFFDTVFGLIREIREIGEIREIEGIGVGVAGALNQTQGLIFKSPNLRFLNGVNLAKLLKKKFRCKVLLDNDANCLLRGELAFGQARGLKEVVALALGTGVGGAISFGGRIILGKHGAAGEIGHTIITGSLERSFTVEDLVSKHAFEVFSVKDPKLWEKKASAGDHKAKKVYQQLGRYLGITLANLVNIFDPELIILGGGISRASRFFLPAALQEMKKHTLLRSRKLPPVRISKLAHVGALGAVSLFLKG